MAINRVNDQKFDNELQEKLVAGVNLIANAVKSTLGPGGRTVIARNGDGSPIITKDGVTVASLVRHDDPWLSLAIDVMRDVSQKAVEKAGDGTTTAMVLAQAIVNYIIKNNPENVIDAAKGANRAMMDIVAELRKNTIPVTDETINQIALISSNGDKKVAETSVEAVKLAGDNGTITLVKDENIVDDEIDVVDGMQFKRGHVDQLFINNKATRSTDLYNGYILMLSDDVLEENDIAEMVRTFSRLHNDSPLVIMARKFDEKVVKSLLTMNRGFRERGIGMQIIPLLAPGYGQRRREMLEDISIYTNGHMFECEPAEVATVFEDKHLGKFEFMSIESRQTTIRVANLDKDAVDNRIKTIRTLMEKTAGFEYAIMEERCALLSGSLVTLRVGGYSATSIGEKHDRYDDAIKAIKSAKIEGVLPGGGSALYRLGTSLDMPKGLNGSERDGYDAVLEAVTEPFKQILINAGHNEFEINAHTKFVSGPNEVYDVRDNKYGDALELGIIDPAVVTITAITYATDIAATLITTGCGLLTESNIELKL